MFVAIRRLVLAAVALLCVIIAAVLAYGNPDPIDLDIGFALIEGVSLTVVLALTFVAGALFGATFFSLAVLRHYRERRALKRELRRVEAELRGVKSLPLSDAD